MSFLNCFSNATILFVTTTNFRQKHAFDEISKILFIKIRYERSNSENQIFSKEQFSKAERSIR
jgi:hypothetical protein